METNKKKVKPSIYNYYTKNENGEVLIYNSLNYKFVKVINERAHDIILKLNQKKAIFEDEILPELIKGGIFIPEDCDELSLVNNVYLNCINNEGVLALFIVVTEQCNFRCPYCFERHENKSISKEIRESIVKFVQSNIYAYKGLAVYWYGGEPLLEMETIVELSEKFINICNKYKKTYFSNISTNGYYLTLENFKKLLDCNVISFQVTIDGIAKTHNMFRVDEHGNGTFDVIMKNLTDIRDNINYGMYEISIRTNYTKEIYKYIDEFINLLKENFAGFEKFRILPRTAVDLGGEAIKEIKSELFKNDYKFEKDIYNRLFNYGKDLRYESVKRQLAPGNSVCYACMKNHYGIDVEGNIFKCNDVFQSNPEWRIGSIVDGKFVIDRYEEAKWVKVWDDIDEECKKCFLFPVCMGGGCSLMLYRHKYLGEKKKRNCMYEKSIIDSILKLLDATDCFEII